MSIHAAEAAKDDASYAAQEEAHGIEPRRVGDVVMEMKNITLRFGGVTAIKDISFDVREHEIRAIIGPNGAGKSSMLNVINGFYHPQEGEIWFRGEKRGPMRPHEIAHQGIARTFQNIALFKGMSTLDNIMTGRMTLMKSNFWQHTFWKGGAEREEVEHRRRVEEIIDFLEIQAIRKTPVGRLPYGLQKRVELGRALAAEPKLLLLDEPMAGLGAEGSGALADLLETLKAEAPILLVEHDMDAVFRLADRVSVLVAGRVIASGPVAEIRADPKVRRAYLGED